MLYRFEEYELSDQEFSLSREGKRISLEPRALRVLLVLAANPGRLQAKKTLLDAVWKGTFVEESTLTRAIAVIRKQLGDDPRTPRLIETVPTQGYRFIARVETSAESSDPPQTTPLPPAPIPGPAPFSRPMPGQEAADVPEATPDRAEPVQAAGPAASRRWSSLSRPAVWAALALLLCVAVLWGVKRSRRGRALSTGDTLVMAEFTNSTGDPVFDDALRQGMLVQLQQSPVLRLASDSQIAKGRRLMGLQPEGLLTAEQGRELCQRIGGTAVLNGSVSRLGSAFVLAVRATRCSNGEQVDAEQIQIAREEDALKALSRMASQLRTRMGEAGATVRSLDTPLAEATTPSLDALKAFSVGIRVFNTQGSAASIPLFQHATELDPQFAWAHAWLGRMYADVGQEELAMRSTERAYGLLDRASDVERFAIAVSYDLLVTGNLERAEATCNAWLQMYPRDVYPRAFLATTIYPAYGQYGKALEAAKASIELDPAFVVGYRNAVTNLIALDRLDEAEQVLQLAAERKVFLPSFVTDSYRIAFLRNDRDRMRQALSAAPRNPWLLYFQSATLAHAGQLRQSSALQEEAVRIAQEKGKPELEASLLVTSAFTHLLYGYPEEAIRRVHAALQLSRARSTLAAGAMALATAGRTAEASSIAQALRKSYPEDTVLRSNSLPSIEAAIALGQNDPQRALGALEQTARFGISLPLYPVYLRGLALLKLRRLGDAAAEFHKIVDRPGLVMNDPLANLAQINLARAYALAGRRDEAQKAYGLVQRRWETAEVSLSALEQVRQEASRLQRAAPVSLPPHLAAFSSGTGSSFAAAHQPAAF